MHKQQSEQRRYEQTMVTYDLNIGKCGLLIIDLLTCLLVHAFGCACMHVCAKCAVVAA